MHERQAVVHGQWSPGVGSCAGHYLQQRPRAKKNFFPLANCTAKFERRTVRRACAYLLKMRVPADARPVGRTGVSGTGSDWPLSPLVHVTPCSPFSPAAGPADGRGAGQP